MLNLTNFMIAGQRENWLICYRTSKVMMFAKVLTSLSNHMQEYVTENAIHLIHIT